MRVVAMIPARLQASRFPKKLLQDLGGLPVIVRTYRAARDAALFDQVVVVTDDTSIAKLIENEGGSVFISKKVHQSGSDRIAEAIENYQTDIVVNVQGDEPFINTQALSDLIDVFQKDVHSQVDVASLMQPIYKREDILDPNVVKVVTNAQSDALYFSRAAIPFHRDSDSLDSYYKHIGIYAYRKQALLAFSRMPSSSLENIEKLEQLRYLENGFRIRMVLTHQSTIGIDTPEDLEKARLFLQNPK